MVASGLANSCELEVAYAIGHPFPTSVHIDTFGTNQVDESKIEAAIKKVLILGRQQSLSN